MMKHTIPENVELLIKISKHTPLCLTTSKSVQRSQVVYKLDKKLFMELEII